MVDCAATDGQHRELTIDKQEIEIKNSPKLRPVGDAVKESGKVREEWGRRGETW